MFHYAFQGARHSLARARAALKYIVLALSGHMDDILGKYKVPSHVLVVVLLVCYIVLWIQVPQNFDKETHEH